MESIVKNSFTLNLSVMKVIGFYPSYRYPRLYQLYAYIIYTFTMIPASLLGILQLFFKETTDGVRYDDLISVVMVFIAPKLLSVVINGHNIQKCIHYFDDEFIRRVNDEHTEIIDNCVTICRRNSIVFFSGCVVSIFSWFTKLFLRENIYQLPLDVWFPFESEHMLFYYSLYFSLVLG
jgi:hypothetical protein